MTEAHTFVWKDELWMMDAHGSMIRLGDGSPPGWRKDILRGDFALVTFGDRDGIEESRLVLCGLSPTNRKLVFRVTEDRATGDWFLELLQDSPGFARPATTEGE